MCLRMMNDVFANDESHPLRFARLFSFYIITHILSHIGVIVICRFGYDYRYCDILGGRIYVDTIVSSGMCPPLC